MEKISFSNLENSLEFQKGAELFREFHNLPVKYPEARKLNQEEHKKLSDLECFNPVKYLWYRKRVSKKEWNKYHLNSNYLILKEDKEEVVFAFKSVVFQSGCLEITDPEELKMIDLYLRSKSQNYTYF